MDIASYGYVRGESLVKNVTNKGRP
jgi:hypothetical protein